MSRSSRTKEFSNADVLVAGDVEAGEPASGEIRLHINAIGLNHSDGAASADSPTIPHAMA
ncbi:hypothetical protein GCM10007874_33400 [Labrys miyagiensis]|uniref:Uncharacterized protein n=1 Tax=Labrys miyagiensis TaxID=346912 RepID=A0ABQ6CJ73_9HYPH|nr:hypothetical protein [Labrys miyagiensis]GLS20323.1 hypothetical protein GCM10007874_33400 [Labrys miyagiensis]